MENEIDSFYLDDGTKVDPNLISKPSLCISTKTKIVIMIQITKYNRIFSLNKIL